MGFHGRPQKSREIEEIGKKKLFALLGPVLRPSPRPGGALTSRSRSRALDLGYFQPGVPERQGKGVFQVEYLVA